jgi:hypothetical protein
MIEIELSYVYISFKTPIVYYRYKEGVELGFPEIRELVQYAEKLSSGKPYVTLSDVRVDLNITEEGKRYVAKPEHMPLFRGTAVLVKNNMFKFAANFMNQFSKKDSPFKAFTDREKAVEWLKELPLY